jgi:hypothetical protein
MGRANPFHRRLEAYDASMDLDEHMARSNARARRGRRIARHLLAVPIFFAVCLMVLYAGQRNYMYEVQPSPMSTLVFGVAVVIFVIGVAWMVRILRAHHEPEAGAWRYRDS